MNRAAYEGLFGGSGQVVVRDALGPTPRGHFTAALRCELAADGQVGAHTQQADDELVVCVGGAGWASVDGTRHEMSPDQPAVWVPHGSVLSLGAGSAPMRYLIIKAARPG